VRATSVYLRKLTDSIGEAPQKRRHMANEALGFCAESARPARSHETLGATWTAMLSQVPQISDRMARAIAAKYPTVTSLMRAYEGLATVEEREALLAPIEVPHFMHSRPIGMAASKRLHTVLCGTPTSPI
jgi:hypothetical protein